MTAVKPTPASSTAAERLVAAFLEIAGFQCVAAQQGVEVAAVALGQLRRWADKLGLREVREGDTGLVKDLLAVMQRGRNDFTRTFRHLATVRTNTDGPAHGVREHLTDTEAFDAWIVDYRRRLRAEQNTDDARRAEAMNRVNPKYVLRNHLAQAAIENAEAGDCSAIATLFEFLSRPYDEQTGMDAYAAGRPARYRGQLFVVTEKRS